MLNERNTLLEDDGIEEEILVEEECSVAQAVWGDIQGNIENQTDLQNALDAKQDSLTEAQLNAVNSGITAEKVTTYDGYADQIASKADQSALNTEATTRSEADTALGTRIDNEALARQQADNGLQTQIDAITSKSDVVDVVANYAALQAYDTSSLGNNDVIKVLDDETHEDALTYYRWSTTTQTWSYIGQEAPYYSKGQMDVMLQGKQDKLTAGANIQIQNDTISATDTTYTAGNGLNLNGTEFSADTDILATKEDLDDYYTKPETDNLLAPKLEAELVAVLPPTGEEGKLYLTPKAHTTQTATGNPITATVAEEAGAIESFKLDGDTYQQTYTGKNLLSLGQASILQGLTISVDTDNNNITVSGTATGSYPHLSDKSGLNIPAGTYAFSIKSAVEYSVSVRLYRDDGTYPTGIGSFIPAGSTSCTFAIDFDCHHVGILLGGVSSGTVVPRTTISELMLESGSTATSFEPYVGGTPSPNPDYPQPIQTVTGTQTVTIASLNLFDGIFELGNISTTTGTDINADTMIRSKNYAVIEGGERYTISVVGGGNVALRFYQSDGTFIGTGQTAASPNTFTAPANAGRVRFVITSNTNLSTKAQCEKGSSATDWTPYYEPVSYPLDLGSIELNNLDDTYLDRIYKDGNDWKVHKATGHSSKDCQVNSISGTSSGPTMASSDGAFFIPNWSWGDAGLEELGAAIASENLGIFKLDANVIGNAGANAMESGTFCQRQGINDRLYFRNTAYIGKTGNEVKATLLAKSGGVNAWWPLATPTDTTITDTTLIAQLEAIRTASLQNGANTITNTATGSNLAGDMEIGYYGFAPRNRYDKWLWLDINNEYEQIGS